MRVSKCNPSLPKHTIYLNAHDIPDPETKKKAQLLYRKQSRRIGSESDKAMWVMIPGRGSTLSADTTKHIPILIAVMIRVRV